jgi:hypothetical protein
MNKYIIISILTVISVFILYGLYGHNVKKEGFDSPKKTLCLVWRNMREGIEDRGIGDKIRGAIYCYRFCNQNGYKFKFDATEDLASNALKNVESDESDKIREKDVHVLLDDIDFSKVVKELFMKNDTVYIFTNKYIGIDTILPDENKFIKKLLEPTQDFEKLVNAKLNALPDNYGVQHFRFDDSVFENDVNQSDEIFKKYDKILSDTYKKTDVLFTNSTNFKKHAIKKYGIATIMCGKDVCEVGHVGLQRTFDEKAKNTFIEFFVLCRAKYINSYTTYGWISNFVSWPAKIYDIPLNGNTV